MQCPICKEEMPLLSKICPVCGHVINDGNTGHTPQELASNLENILQDIKNIPEPTFMQGMTQLTYIIFPILTLYLLVLAIISEAGLFWILALIFVILSVIQFRKKIKGVLGNGKFDKLFKEKKVQAEYYERIARQGYGKSKEITSLLNDISSQITQIEQRRKEADSKNLIIWVVIMVVFFMVSAYGVISVGKMINAEEEQIEQLIEF